MKNPLIKRVPREFLHDYKKYIAVFLFLAIMVSFSAGDYVASDSMLSAIDGSYEKYNVEDGNFRTDEKLSDELIKSLESGESVEDSIDKIAKVDELIDDYLEETDVNEIIDEFKKSATKEDLKESYKENLDRDDFLEEYKKEIDPDEFMEEYKKSVDPEGTMGDYFDTLDPNEVIDQYLEEMDVDKAIDGYFEEADINELIDDYLGEMSDEEIKDEVRNSLDKDEFLSDMKEEILEDYEDGNVEKIKIYENFYKDVEEDIDLDGKKDATVRVFKIREDVNIACVNEGRLPENGDEIVIDRMHANNRKIKIGDKISISGKEYKVVGLIALPDYSCLYQKNTDTMFDAINFNIALLPANDFEKVVGKLYYSYSWKYVSDITDDIKEKEVSDKMVESFARKAAVNGNGLADFVPNYANNAINFARDDLGGDTAMMKYLVYILIAVIAFIFAVTINNTIEKESAVIGTLRASGYTRGELLKHYLTVPVIITLAAAIVGNILGYTCMKNLVVALYYNSYSLPTYETLWNQKAFIETTCIPVILMVVINTYMIYRKLKLSPLKFLRHDLAKHKKQKAMRLPRISFFGRFRMRIFLQNMVSYFILMFGIFFTSVLLVFCTAFPDTLDHYKDTAVDNVIAPFQYILKSNEDEDGNKIETKNKDAKSVIMNTIITDDKYEEETTIYGMDLDETKDLKADGKRKGEVIISTAYRDKYKVKKGDTIKLKEKFENIFYEFKVEGFYENGNIIAVFLNPDEYRTVFDEEDGFFNAILSDSEVTDIDEEYIYSSITEEDISKVSRQLEHSMGDYMDMFKIFCFGLALILMYLLTKIIIEKNEQSISMVKVLGYTNGEVNKLYILTTAIVVIVVTVFSEAISIAFMNGIWGLYLKSMSGWLPMYLTVRGVVLVYLIVVVAFFVVTLFDMRRIKKIPLTAALKNVE